MIILKMLIWFLLIAIGIFIVLTGYLYFNQKNMVFFPVKEILITPAQIDIEYEEVYLSLAENKSVHGWYFPGIDSNIKRAVLFCHGNAGNISHRLETAQFLIDLKVAVLMFDYRGYGNSDGKPGEDNFYTDSRAFYDWLITEKKFKPLEIIIFGRSLGGAVAVDLASKVTSGGLILESSFTSVTEMGKKIFPFFPIKLLLKHKFDAISKIGSINCPILITHSPDDEIVPYQMGKALFEKANEPKQFVELSGYHNERDYLHDKRYIEAFRKFLYH